MAKSLRSKWKRKMRGIKRETMDEKVLIRMKKMIADAEEEQKIDAAEAGKTLAEKKRKDQAKKDAEPQEMSEPEPELEGEVEESSENEMEVEGEGGKKKKQRDLLILRDDKGVYPSWMTTKKIRKHARLSKRIKKRTTKEAKKAKCWKIASSL